MHGPTIAEEYVCVDTAGALIFTKDGIFFVY